MFQFPAPLVNHHVVSSVLFCLQQDSELAVICFPESEHGFGGIKAMMTPLVCIEWVSPSEWICSEHMLKKPERHCQREGSSFWGPAVPCMLKQSPNRAKSQTNRPGLILGQFSALQNILFFLLWNLPTPIEIHALGPFIHIHVNEVIVCCQLLPAVFMFTTLSKLKTNKSLNSCAP